MSDVLRLAVKQQLGGLEMLKAAVAGTAAGMAGSGHVWLVSDEKGQLAVLPTFAAGTLLVRERRATPLEIPASDVTRTNVAPAPAPGAGAYFAAPRPAGGAPAGARALSTSAPAQDGLYGGGRPAANVYGTSAAADAEMQSRVATNMAGGSTASHDARKLGSLWPLFCVSVHERNWLAAGHGVWGQERWLAQFWPVLDWARVSRRYDELTHDARTRMQNHI
jgi:Fe-Mn family superoxide dismutase